jgi:hypothetical protein
MESNQSIVGGHTGACTYRKREYKLISAFDNESHVEHHLVECDSLVDDDRFDLCVINKLWRRRKDQGRAALQACTNLARLFSTAVFGL